MERIGIAKFAGNLRENTPRSELWFLNLAKNAGFVFWKGNRLHNWDDKFNVPLYGILIPDMHNIKLKTVIEMDGGIHNLEEQKEKDARKDRLYAKWGFDVFRIKTYDAERVLTVLKTIEERRNEARPKKNIRKRVLKTGWQPANLTDWTNR